jgi:hypothetical protein
VQVSSTAYDRKRHTSSTNAKAKLSGKRTSSLSFLLDLKEANEKTKRLLTRAKSEYGGKANKLGFRARNADFFGSSLTRALVADLPFSGAGNQQPYQQLLLKTLKSKNL